jgi:LPXTG-motif cell wall-anchored protein
LEETGAFGIGDDGFANPGDVITYEFEVTNDGNVPLTDIDVADLDLGGINVSCPKTDLGIGESMTCTADYPVTQGDIDAGVVDNCALASGQDPLEKGVSDEDCIETPIPNHGAITIVKDSFGGVGTFAFTSATLGDFSLTTVKVATNATAETTFNDLTAGSYDVTETEQASWYLGSAVCDDGSDPGAIDLAAGEHVTCTFSNYVVLGTAQLGDTVFLDKNKDGKQQADEPGINGAKVFLKDANGTLIATATTAKGPWDGWYKFVGLDAGKYTASLDTKSVSGELTTAGSFTITLVDGQEYLDADFGVAETLPKTGMDAAALGLLGLMLLAAGAVAVMFGRRRREEG